MSKAGLSGREIGGGRAGAAEQSFYGVFLEAFKGTNLSVRWSPAEFSRIYVDVELPGSVLSGNLFPPGGIS